MTGESSNEFGAWTTYVSRFFDGAERQYGIAKANFCECFREAGILYCTCTNLRDHMTSVVHQVMRVLLKNIEVT